MASSHVLLQSYTYLTLTYLQLNQVTHMGGKKGRKIQSVFIQ